MNKTNNGSNKTNSTKDASHFAKPPFESIAERSKHKQATESLRLGPQPNARWARDVHSRPTSSDARGGCSPAARFLTGRTSVPGVDDASVRLRQRMPSVAFPLDLWCPVPCHPPLLHSPTPPQIGICMPRGRWPRLNPNGRGDKSVRANAASQFLGYVDLWNFIARLFARHFEKQCWSSDACSQLKCKA